MPATPPDSNAKLAHAVLVRDARSEDGAAIASIYNHYVANTVVTFEEEAVSTAEMSRRMADVAALSLPWLVAEIGGLVVGYAYATAWRARAAYRHSAEVTVYLTPDRAGAGIGTALYTRLLDELRARGRHAVMGGIALPNDASVRLHEKLGFEKVAHFREVGWKHDRWVDVAFWQRIL
jgi:phosphinothricin acetyltransferase